MAQDKGMTQASVSCSNRKKVCTRNSIMNCHTYFNSFFEFEKFDCCQDNFGTKNFTDNDTNRNTLTFCTKNLTTLDITLSVLLCLITIFGFCGNLALFRTYWKKNRQLRFNVLMLILAGFDSTFLGLLIGDWMVSTSFFTEGLTGFAFTDGLPKAGLFLFAFNGAVFTTLSISIERFMYLCKGK